MTDPSPATEVVNVNAHNLEKEFFELLNVVKSGYSVICFDTEFPGFSRHNSITKYVHESNKTFEYMRYCVWLDDTNLIQLGITLGDENMNIYHKSWQFNFKFNLKDMRYQYSAIEMLKEAGIDFKTLESNGIQYHEFFRLFKSSGLLKNPELLWITFFGIFDYGYLLKYVHDGEFPSDASEFPALFQSYFPCSFDVKYFPDKIEKLKYKKKLVDLAYVMGIQTSNLHQAGWDSWLTLKTFFAVKAQMIEKCGRDATKEFFETFGNIVFRSGVIAPCLSWELIGALSQY